MKPGDYVIQRYAAHEANIWLVTGVYLGALGHQDVVGLVAVNRRLPSAHGEVVTEMLVPLELAEPYLVETRFPANAMLAARGDV